MLIFIRHADDSGGGAKHDTTITHKGKEAARKVAKRLIKKYGPPTLVVASPFVRARETVKQMHLDCPKMVDVTVSKYFPKEQQRHPDVEERTLLFKPPIEETKKDVKARVKRFLRHYKNHKGVVWCVTHGIVVSYASAQLTGRKMYDVPFLGTFVVGEPPRKQLTH